MNNAQKKGVGSLIAIAIAAVSVVCQIAGVELPVWFSQATTVLGVVAGVFGIAVNYPSVTK